MDQAAVLHGDIVRQLFKQIEDIQKVLADSRTQLEELQKQVPTGAAARKTRGSTRLAAGFDAEFVASQRKVLELQEMVRRLKQCLADQDAGKPASVDINNMDSYDMMTLEKELEMEQTIKLLTEEMKKLKQNNKFLENQLTKYKQIEIVNEKKVAAYDQSRKTAEGNLANLATRMEQMEQMYKDKLAVAELTVVHPSASDDAAIAVRLSHEWQQKIDALKREHAKAIEKLTMDMEGSYQGQLKEMTAAFATGNSDTVVKAAVAQMNSRIGIMMSES
jgi:chromosome segregation ATPase